jgi:hypothetical protein
MESNLGFQESSALKVTKFGGLCARGSKAIKAIDITGSQQLVHLCAREPFVKQQRRQTRKQCNEGRSKIANLLLFQSRILG